MTKKKASLPFNISSSCFSNALKEPKGRGKGKGRQDYRGQGATLTAHHHQRAAPERQAQVGLGAATGFQT